MYFNFYEVCVFIAVIAFVVVSVFLVRLLIQARRTACAVEELAKTANANVERTNATFELIESISKMLNNTWFKVFAAGFGLAKNINHKKHKKEKEDDEE